jgi:hypothetical protein
LQADEYIKNQNFNFLTKRLHKWRFLLAKKFIESEIDVLDSSEKSICIVDFGCGTASFFDYLVNEDVNKGRFKYLGVEVSDEFIEHANTRYASDTRFSMVKNLTFDDVKAKRDDLHHIFISLETFEHLQYCFRIETIKNLGEYYNLPFLITVPNELGWGLLVKNIGSLLMGYSARFKEYGWRNTYYAFNSRLDQMSAHTTYHKGFDWRALQYEIRQFCKFKLYKRRFLGIALISIAFMRSSKLKKSEDK